MFIFINRDYKYSVIEPQRIRKINQEDTYSFRNRRLETNEKKDYSEVENDNVKGKPVIRENLNARRRNYFQKKTKIQYLQDQKSMLKGLFETLFENINHKFIQAEQTLNFEMEYFS